MNLSTRTKWVKLLNYLRVRDANGRFSNIIAKGDNFCDFLFAPRYTKSLLKGGLL